MLHDVDAGEEAGYLHHFAGTGFLLHRLTLPDSGDTLGSNARCLDHKERQRSMVLNRQGPECKWHSVGSCAVGIVCNAVLARQEKAALAGLPRPACSENTRTPLSTLGDADSM